MSEIAATDDLLNKAFNLAYFILGDRTASIYIAMVAMDKLKIASTVQDRRLYYMPTGRSNNPAARTKVSLSQVHLLQRLVYTESEPFERLLEAQGSPLQQHEMIIRFIKHLVRVTTKHNSFYVALSLSRLLHNYTTGETMEIYNLIIQDPDRGRDDYYYRSRKKHLMRELKERFGHLLRTERGYRGEERFRVVENTGKYTEMVRECLLRFTPWGTPCVLPTQLDPAKSVLPALQFKGASPDQEHEIELNRIHTLLHPDCFERLVIALGLDTPAGRLEVPHFFVSGVDDGPTDDRLKQQTLTNGELDAMRRYLDKSVTRRNTTSKKSLSILVDREERAYLEVGRINSVQVAVDDDSEFIEVRSIEANEAVPLSVHPLTTIGGSISLVKPSVMLWPGQNLSFVVQPLNDSITEETGATIHVEYREVGKYRLISTLLKQPASRLHRAINSLQTGVRDPLKLTLGFLAAAICVSGFLLYLYLRSASSDTRLAAEHRGDFREGANKSGTPLPLPTIPQPQAPQAQGGKSRISKLPPSRPQPMSPRNSNSARDEEATRGRPRGLTSLTLPAIKRIYIDPLGEMAESQEVREMLKRRFEASGRFVIVEARNEADAVFKGFAKPVKGSGNVSLTLRLVNAEGQVIWSTALGRSKPSYSGSSSDVADRVVTALIEDIRKLEGGL